MDELLFHILAAIIEILFEFLLEFASEAIVDVVSRVLVVTFSNPPLAVLGYLVLGMISGGFSALLFPHPFFHPSRIRGISLLISPFVTGSLMAFIGNNLRRQGKQSVRIESFTYGFAFALGMAFIRLVFAR